MSTIRSNFLQQHRWIFFLLFAFLSVALACNAETKAQRLYDKAVGHVDKGELEEAIAVYQEVIDRYPQSEAARRARKQIVLYRGLGEAVERFPLRDARALMVKTARAIERYKARHGRAPESLDRLLPNLVAEPPIDPWGRPLIYERTSRRGYRLTCYGADGRPGGAGEAADWQVRNGSFVSDPAGGAE